MTAIGIATNVSLLEALAQDLGKEAQTLCDHLRATGLGQPSFDRDTPTAVLPPESPQEVHDARVSLMSHALEIFRLAAGPSEYVTTVIKGHHEMESLRWLTRFKIFDLVPSEGSISYAELASLAGVTELRLKSLARMAMTSHLFTEPSPGHIAHSATSASLRTGSELADCAVWASSFIAPTVASMVKAHEQWPTSTAPNHTPFNVAFNTDLPMYQYISTQPNLYKLFGRVMKLRSKTPETNMKHLVNGFDWERLGKATVVDIGGNAGHGCVALAKAFPNLDFIVQDTPQVVAEGERSIRALYDDDLATRIKFQAHDFFQRQPVVGAGVYLIRFTLHNWDLESSAKILEKVVPAMNEGSHILIMDIVLPEPGAVALVHEQDLRWRDVLMMQLLNATERDMKGWQDVLARVGPRLKMTAVNTPRGSHLSVIDLVLGR